VKLTLLASKQMPLLPLNCNHAVVSLIYGTLGHASTDFAGSLNRTNVELKHKRRAVSLVRH
jgi:CRISPR/Cas system endoribonuclease Cas6 (RAMP superfamily)